MPKKYFLINLNKLSTTVLLLTELQKLLNYRHKEIRELRNTQTM